MKLFRRIYYKLFPAYRRLELVRVTYHEADQMILDSEHRPEAEQWRIAREEDTNRVIGVTYIERRIRIIE